MFTGLLASTVYATGRASYELTSPPVMASSPESRQEIAAGSTATGYGSAIFYTQLHDQPLLAAGQPVASLLNRKALHTIDTHISERIGHVRHLPTIA